MKQNVISQYKRLGNPKYTKSLEQSKAVKVIDKMLQTRFNVLDSVILKQQTYIIIKKINLLDSLNIIFFLYHELLLKAKWPRGETGKAQQWNVDEHDLTGWSLQTAAGELNVSY